MLGFLKKKRAPEDVENNVMGKSNIKNTAPENFDFDKAWREGLIMTINTQHNPQEFADNNFHIYENNNKVLIWIAGVFMLLIVIFALATTVAFWNINKPNFYTTTPNGMVQKLTTSENPSDFRLAKNRVLSDKEIAEFSTFYLNENKDKIKWFNDKAPNKITVGEPLKNSQNVVPQTLIPNAQTTNRNIGLNSTNTNTVVNNNNAVANNTIQQNQTTVLQQPMVQNSQQIQVQNNIIQQQGR